MSFLIACNLRIAVKLYFYFDICFKPACLLFVCAKVFEQVKLLLLDNLNRQKEKKQIKMSQKSKKNSASTKYCSIFIPKIAHPPFCAV